MAATYAEVERLLASAGERYLLLLLTETSEAVLKVKPGIPALSYKVLDQLTASGGPLDEVLTTWAKQRPSRVLYRRLPMDRNDSKTMTFMSVKP